MAASSSKKKTSRSTGKKTPAPAKKAAKKAAMPASPSSSAQESSAKPMRLDYLLEKLEEEHGDLSTLPPLLDNLDILFLSHLALQMSLADAKKAFVAIKTQFVDWNEIRISTTGEVKEILRGATEPLELAIFLKDFLQRLFLEQHHVGLEFLRDRSNPEIRSFFKKHPGFAESSIGLLLERVNDYPVVPLEVSTQPFLERVGFGAAGTTPLARQKELYEKIPRDRVLAVSLLINEHGRATCPPSDEALDCPDCPLKRGCPFPSKVTPRQRAAALRSAGK